ncbi:NAD(P)H-dependent oxidoreductase [Paucibacter sp. APW11]|uniref:NAD(P)H-dependent oxidoreductase n=1 Tax=Roseateles aquae TaxID=3077235 RepID=A0ABU3PHY5_9BURK|nr:NAD(P)H-dependent oxidoreductase [Paucibacter sp. APW11]MDT9001732.1 NAD(P)H-dependent oxidoreductase [Paucibacter sp. APW11]
MSKRILVIDAHPKAGSLSQALAQRYADAARAAGHQVELVELRTLRYEFDLPHGYNEPAPLEPDLVRLQEQIRQAQHLVWAYPVWWGSVPARLKGLLDRILQPGYAFRYQRGQTWPERLLKGRSARLLVCLDTPGWYFRWLQGAPAHRMMKTAVLEFCGISPVRISEFTPVIKSSAAQRERWLAQAADLGRLGA